MIDLFDVVLNKHTGVSGYSSEVNSISFKTVDSAVWLDSIDAMNYPVRAPYGTIPFNRSYENWIRFSFKFNRRYRQFVKGDYIEFVDDSGCTVVYDKVINPRIWVEFKRTEAFEIKFGFADIYSKPVKTESTVATKNIKAIHSKHYDEAKSIELPLTSKPYVSISEMESITSPFFVTQLTAFKGSQFQNCLISVGIRYDLA